MNGLSALQPDEDTISLLFASGLDNFLSQAEHRAHSAELKTQVVDNFAVRKLKQRRTLVDQSYFYAQRGKHRAVFDTHNSCTDHDQLARDVGQVLNLVRVQDVGTVYGKPVRV